MHFFLDYDTFLTITKVNALICKLIRILKINFCKFYVKEDSKKQTAQQHITGTK